MLDLFPDIERRRTCVEDLCQKEAAGAGELCPRHEQQKGLLGRCLRCNRIMEDAAYWNWNCSQCSKHQDKDANVRLRKRYGAELLREQRHRCGIAVCGVEITMEPKARPGLASGEIDHIQARRNGGRDEPKNLQLLCRECNTRKSAMNAEDFRRQKEMQGRLPG